MIAPVFPAIIHDSPRLAMMRFTSAKNVKRRALFLAKPSPYIPEEDSR